MKDEKWVAYKINRYMAGMVNRWPESHALKDWMENPVA
jgi:hypothetical protein